MPQNVKQYTPGGLYRESHELLVLKGVIEAIGNTNRQYASNVVIHVF